LSILKKLAGQTAMYGLSSIVGRLLNYLLVPLYTRLFLPEEYGVVTELYAYVSFLIIVLTYGLETSLFRFSKTEEDSAKVYSTILISILGSTATVIAVLIFLAPAIALEIGYPNHPEYIYWFIFIIGLDALSAIPFARLREENKAGKFALIKLINIFTNIGFNLFFLVFSPWVLQSDFQGLSEFINYVYNPEIGIGYIFISNLIAAVVTIVLLIPDLIPRNWTFDFSLWKKIMAFSLPLLVAGLAGMTNESADRLMLKYLLPRDISMYQVGIYGACYKIAILMTIFIQAYRYAAEPFFFAQFHEKNKTSTYATVMNYFVVAGCLIFLGVMLYMDVVKHFLDEKYWEGLDVVPILLLANLFLGIYFNLSIWYKLTGKSMYGAYIAIIGAVVTIVLNLILIPKMGYMGAAWTTLVCYTLMMVISYLMGQKHFPVNYNLGKITAYIGLSAALFFVSEYYKPEVFAARMAFNSLLLLIFIVTAFILEKRKQTVS
jgi:O-antigen/teichoic acid export membrane protein